MDDEAALTRAITCVLDRRRRADVNVPQFGGTSEPVQVRD